MAKEETQDDPEVVERTLRPPERVGTASSSAQTTTSSDQMIMEKLEDRTQGNGDMDDDDDDEESVGGKEKEEEQLKTDQPQLLDLPDEDEIFGSFDCSDPFKDFDPDEPLFEKLDHREMKLILSHEQVLEGWRNLGQANEVKQEVEEDEEGSRNGGNGGTEMGTDADMERDADEWVGGEEEGEAELITADQGEEVMRLQVPKSRSRSNPPENQGRKRARSEASRDEEEEDIEDQAPQTKRARIETSGRSSSSTTSQDVQNWVSNVSQGRDQGEEEEEEEQEEQDPQNNRSDRATPNLPTPTLRQQTTTSSPRIPRASQAVSATRPIPPAVTQKPVAPRESTASTSTALSTGPDPLRAELQVIADDLQIPFSVIHGLHFCLSSPSNSKNFKKLSSYYSKQPMEPSTRKSYRKVLLMYEWTFEEDRVVLEGTEVEKRNIEKAQKKKKVEERKSFLGRANIVKVDQLPKEHYVRDY